MERISHIRSLFQGQLKKTEGREIRYAKDCQNLAVSIRQETKRSLSVSTLKRLFGIIDYPYHPSKYTLDTLSLYLGFRSWSDLQENYSPEQVPPPEVDYWSKLKSRIDIITNRSLASIRARLTDQIKHFKPREFAFSKFELFLNSPYAATAYIAPGGYGKTTIATQLTEHFFTAANARYPNDIVCLIDGSILVNLMNLNLELVRIKNIIDFQEKASFSNYFLDHPDQVKGRFVLIIESLYQIYYQEEKLKNFVANLMDLLNFYRDTPWFKCVITCRPDNWKLLTYHIQNRPEIRECWYDVNFTGSTADYVNVPLLNEDEIDHFLRKRHPRRIYEKLKFLYPDIKELLSQPSLLYLFSSLESSGSIHSDLELLEHYFSNRIFVEPYLEEKYAITEALIKKTQYARNSFAVRKSELPSEGSHKAAYEALVFNNVIYDYSIPGQHLSVATYVRFANDILLGYLLANTWISENQLNPDLVEKVYSYYETNPPLRSNVIKYLIKIAFKEGNTEVLSGILPLLHMDHHLWEVIDTIGLELRKDKKIRESLLPVYAGSGTGRSLCFENSFDMDSLVLFSGKYVDLYLEHQKGMEGKVYGHFLKFMQYFLSDDAPNCKILYDWFRSQKTYTDLSARGMAYLYAAQVIFQSCIERDPDPDLLQKIRKSSKNFQDPAFGYVLMVALNFGDHYPEIIRLSERARRDSPDKQPVRSWETRLCNMIYARALLQTGQISRAKQVYEEEVTVAVPYNIRNYVAILSGFIELEFLGPDERPDEALRILGDIKTTSKMLKFKYFTRKAQSVY